MKTLKIVILCLLSLLISSCGNADGENTISATGTVEATFITLSSKVAGEILKLILMKGLRLTQVIQF